MNKKITAYNIPFAHLLAKKKEKNLPLVRKFESIKST